ncbi:SSI family serine proteinase inhibitor [Nonomuraea sp. NPDC003804]|uniref:SSI family serine proteinase inhibitor n=1 Tax=Nonomuraea sp. NPDC003804 TaxID=3154547 RepID=UPI0033AB3533
MRFVKIAALATAALIATSATASAAPASSSRALFIVQVTVPSGWTRVVSLTCDPEGGAHPQAATSCALLDTVEGDLARHPAEQGMCTREYDPRVAELTGWWEGSSVHFERTFGNRCEMLLSTGSVFDL